MRRNIKSTVRVVKQNRQRVLASYISLTDNSFLRPSAFRNGNLLPNNLKSQRQSISLAFYLILEAESLFPPPSI